jgi:hypothetical protein
VSRLLACLLISQPLVEYRLIFCFYFYKLDAHSLCVDVISHFSYGRKLGSAMFNAHTYAGSRGKRSRSLDESKHKAK